jgi:hypothetical protein
MLPLRLNNFQAVIVAARWAYMYVYIQKNTGDKLDAVTGVGLEVNPEKTKYMLMSYCEKAGQSTA